MLLKVTYFLVLLEAVLAQIVYDAYFGKPVTDQRREELAKANATGACTITVEACKKEEGRRVDGTCANPRYPSRGGAATPLLRMLPPKFGLGNSLRPARNGSELPSTRIIRTEILTEGFTESPLFTTLASHVLVFSFIDNVELLYMNRYAIVSECCTGNRPNPESPGCIPITVPQDDPTLRRTGIRCMNLTRFITYQDKGCIPNTLPAERYNLATPLVDLSMIYGSTDEQMRVIRSNKGGLLISEERDGKERPPGTSPFCLKNRPPRENSCLAFGDPFDTNLLAGNFLTSLWFFREHNRLARSLARINPCWDDEQLFQKARQINIAQWQHIFYYEIIGTLLGRENAMKAGILYETSGYVNDFDERLKPGVYHEYVTAGRWFHTLQDGRTDLYSQNGKWLGTRTAADDEFRSGILDVNNTEADLTQGSIWQPSANIDWNMDYDMVERVSGELQAALDVVAIDMQRGRDAGFPPYNEYRKICGLPYAYDWDDFKDTIWPDKVEQLKRLYEEVDDLDLMAAIYSEKLLPGSWVGPTLFCIMARNLVEWRRSDRHFFEHGDIEAALTLLQLNEVRKTSLARLLCDNGDRVNKIQPYAMYLAGKGNEMVSCEVIPGMNLNMWKDPACDPKQENQKKEVLTTTMYTNILPLPTLNPWWINYIEKK